MSQIDIPAIDRPEIADQKDQGARQEGVGGQPLESAEAVAAEKREARERFRELIALVSERYESLPEKVREDFIVHNGDILDNVVELGIRKKLDPDELKALEIAAILHDLNKADAVPEKHKDVPNYILVMHGELAAHESQKILTDEKLKEYGFQGDPDEFRNTISQAIRQHMGPHPGFMTAMLEKANAVLRAKGEKEIVHPEARGKVSEVLLAADMESLAGAKGRKKVMSLRENGDFFKGQDQKTAEQFRGMGVELSMGEAALLSGFESAFQARDMMKDPELKAWIDDAITRSMDQAYDYGEYRVDPLTALAKKNRIQLLADEEKSDSKATEKEEELRRKIAGM